MGAHKQRDAQASLQQVDLLVHCRRGDEQLLRRSSLLRLVALAADVRPFGQLIGYEALKFYCNEGLVPCVKRDANNHHIFVERDVAWISSLTCLK